MAGRPGPEMEHRTLVVGVGNPVLGDDGVGWQVAEEVRRRLAAAPGGSRRRNVTVETAAVGGLSLMERLIGYPRAILVDAITAGPDAPGTVTVRDLRDVSTRATGHLDSAHDAPLPAALRAGAALGAELPASITVVGIAANVIDTFGDDLSAPVRTAVGTAATSVMRLLDGEA